jgi:hypothetical protein
MSRPTSGLPVFAWADAPSNCTGCSYPDFWSLSFSLSSSQEFCPSETIRRTIIDIRFLLIGSMRIRTVRAILFTILLCMGLILPLLCITAFTGIFNEDAPFDFSTSLLITLSDFDPDNGVSDALHIDHDKLTFIDYVYNFAAHTVRCVRVE